eukprot:TRINITY_DN3996_c0_g1_i1.p1 TRINITY_DN3996_c0_g1~~TRINITY_DN3996_c0_g1_i1.p1  ORF type:complete len:925 (-),score=249.56 TRINITY_DN3996_c0_g1_i1:46-2820(-)
MESSNPKKPNPEESLNNLRQFLLQSHWKSGLEAFSDENHQKALDLVDKALLIQPDLPEVLSLKAAVLFDLKEYKMAGECLDQILQNGDLTEKLKSRTYAYKALLANVDKRWDESLHYISLALAVSPEDIFANFTKATTLLKKGNLELAMSSIDRCLALSPNDTDSLILKAHLYFQMGKPREALAHMKKVHELNPMHKPAFTGLIFYQMLLGNHDETLGHAQEFVKSFPSSGEAHFLHALSLLLLQRVTEAEVSLDEVIKTKSDYSGQGMFLKGLILQNQNKHEEAIKVFESLSKTQPHPLLYYSKAFSNAKLGNLQQAVEDYSVVMKEKNTFFDGYAHRGNLYVKLKDFQSAKADYEKLLDIEEYKSPALMGLGVCHYGLGDTPKAVSFIKKAIQEDPKTPYAHQLLANIHYVNKNYSEAAGYYTAALAFTKDPQVIKKILHLKAACLMNMQKEEEALSCLKRALQEPSKPKEVVLSKTLPNSQIVKLNETDFHTAIVSKPTSLSYKTRQSIDWDLWSSELDEFLLEKKRWGDQEGLNYLAGYLLYSKERYDEATSHFNECIQKDPHNQNLWIWKSEALIQGGKYAEALDAVGKATDLNVSDVCSHSLKSYLLAMYGYNEALPQTLTLLDEAIQRFPSDYLPLYFKGLLLLQASDYKSSIEALQKSLQFYPKTESLMESDCNDLFPSPCGIPKVKINHALAQSLLYLTQTTESPSTNIDYCNESIQHDPINYAAHLVKGINLMKLSRKEEAKVEFETAIRINPISVRGYLEMGELYLQEDKEKGLYFFQKATEIAPSVLKNEKELVVINKLKTTTFNLDVEPKRWGVVYRKLADGYNSLGKHKEALLFYNKLEEEYPQDSEVLLAKGKILLEMGKYNDALICLDKALEATTSEEVKSSASYYRVVATVKKIDIEPEGNPLFNPI